MKCKWDSCENESRTKSEFCSDRCNKRFRRSTRTKSDSIVSKPDKASDLAKPGQTAPSTQSMDAQEAAQSTKSDGLVVEQPVTRKQLEDVGADAGTIEALAAYPSAFDAEQPITNKQYANCLRQGEGDLLLSGEVPDSTLRHYYDQPDQYYPRLEPEKLNWGKWMSAGQLKQAGFKANRVPIPGDWDYEGRCTSERIDADHKLSLGIAHAAPVDEVSVEV